MNSSSNQDALSMLYELSLITESQRDLARQHPDASQALAPDFKLGEVLAWMVSRDIVPEEEFLTTAANLMESFSDDALLERESVIDVAQEKLCDIKFMLNHRTLSVLLDEHVITEAQFARIVEALPSDGAFASPAAAMMWIIINDLLSDDEQQAIQTQLEVERTLPSAHSRVAILAETNEKLQEAQAIIHQAAKQQFWDNVFPGGRWLWAAGFVLVFGGFSWYAFSPTPTPACDSSNIVKTVDNMMFAIKIAARPNIIQHTRSTMHGLRRPREVGYLAAEKIRGCVGAIGIDNSELPYGYTITPSPDNRSEFVVAGTNPEIVMARFGHIDAQGRLANQAEPVGRKNLETAIRAGVFALQEKTGSHRALDRLRELNQPKSSLITTDPKREREVADLEPIGPCRVLTAGTRYSCDVMLERNDALLAALSGSGLTIVNATFTLERDSEASHWRVSSDFTKEYIEAITRSRLTPTTGAGKE